MLFLKKFPPERPEGNLFITQWPVYAPYRIYEVTSSSQLKEDVEVLEDGQWVIKRKGEIYCEPTGSWLISGNQKQYRQVWEQDSPTWERDVKEIRFINQEEKALLKHALKIDTASHASILEFVNRYGLLGTSFRESPQWLIACVPPVSFGVYNEDLFEFQRAILEIQGCYKLWKEIKAGYETRLGKKEAEGRDVLLGRFRNNLVGIREYPQIDKHGMIVSGKAGQTLLDYIWLQFYEVITGKVKECVYCGSVFKLSHDNRKLCPECQPFNDKLRKARRRKEIKASQNNLPLLP
jgi:ribosomal protein S27AE